MAAGALFFCGEEKEGLGLTILDLRISDEVFYLRVDLRLRSYPLLSIRFELIQPGFLVCLGSL